MTTFQAAILTVVVIFLSTVAIHLFSGPSNYDDCILNNMPSGTSNVAAMHIARACESKFPTAIKKSASSG
jgi:hypothetical protein